MNLDRRCFLAALVAAPLASTTLPAAPAGRRLRPLSSVFEWSPGWAIRYEQSLQFVGGILTATAPVCCLFENGRRLVALTAEEATELDLFDFSSAVRERRWHHDSIVETAWVFVSRAGFIQPTGIPRDGTEHANPFWWALYDCFTAHRRGGGPAGARRRYLRRRCAGGLGLTED